MLLKMGSSRKSCTEHHKSHGNVNKDTSLKFTEEHVNIL